VSYDYDLIVIGSGPGGYVAAIRAAQLGLQTLVVEKDAAFGGTCLHRGCIPTKALLATADLLERFREAETFGIEAGPARLDLTKAHAYKDGVVAKNAKGIAYLMRKNGIETLQGWGRLGAGHSVVVERDGATRTRTARCLLLATGSVPRPLPIAPVDGVRILNSDHALKLAAVPASIAVLGGGAVGCEFASLFASFGARVTLIEMLPRLLPLEDEDISKELARVFRQRGIAVRTGTGLASVDTDDGGVHLALAAPGEDPGETLDADSLLVATGRAPVTGDLGLEAAGVSLDPRGYVAVEGTMQTNLPHVYAIGDLVATPWLAHVASHEGILAAEHMAGRPVTPIDYDRVPSCTYCDPEVASVGLTEAQARERGHEVSTGTFPLSALGKAAILKRPQGFVKLVRENRYDELLGAHIVGVHATDLIAEACVALRIEATTEELMRTIHAHPTLSEAVMEAAHAALGHSIHI